MIAIPIVEIRGGVCVPVPVGDVLYGVALDDPTDGVRAWSALGFSRVQVVDQDAVAGVGSNASLLEDLIRDAGIEIIANGGVQTMDGIQRLIDAGATQVILGTRAVAEPEWLSSVAESNPGLLVVETSLRERRVVVRGWVRSLPLDIFDVIEELDGLPLAGLLVASGQADGNRDAMDLSLLEDIAEACEFPVLAAGRVTSLNDLRALEHRGVSAVVLHPALFAAGLDARSVAQEFGG